MTPNMTDFETLLEDVRQEVVRNVLTRLDSFDEPSDKLNAVRAIAALASERDRDQATAVTPLGPDSMIGSYFRAPDPNDTIAESAWLDGEPCKTIEGQIVAQPFTSPTGATYLVEFYGDSGATGFQQLVELERMVMQRWAFYDTAAWLKGHAPQKAVTVPDDESEGS
jgi:hypothetical protein